MATKGGLDMGSTGRRDVECSICAENKKVNNSEYYCSNCQKHMCTSCLRKHNELYEYHEVVEGLEDVKDMLTEKCSLQDHRKCQDPQNISESSDELNADSLVSYDRKIDVRISGEESKCIIVGVCHFSDGSLVIADKRHKRLKRVDLPSREVTNYCDTEQEPEDICCIGPQEFAVSFKTTEVHVYNAVSLILIRTIDLGHETNRIACHDSLLYAGWGKILYVHNLRSGCKLYKIRPKDTEGQDIFHIIQCIALNGPGDRVYVTDMWGDLVCVNPEGRLIFHRTQRSLGQSYSTGAITDHRDHVFVCIEKSNSVVKVAKNGHVVGEIFSGKDGIEVPLCLSYDVSKSQLYVGGESDQLLMFEVN